MAKFKSQADAPVELVVAIIILLASLSVAMLVMKGVEDQRCSSELNGEVQKLQLAMQDLALQSPPSTRKIFFNIPRCGDEKIDAVRFVYFSRADFCGRCPGHFAGCWMLQMVSINQKTGVYNIKQDICVDMAGDIDLKTGDVANQCVALGETPCTEGNENDCDVTKTGYTSKVFTYNDPTNPSRWATLTTDKRTYQIDLQKSIGGCRQDLTTSCPQIIICAKEPGAANP
jgi:hypothetical protein